MKYMCLVLMIALLQSCYLDDNDQRKEVRKVSVIKENLDYPINSVIQVTESQSKIVKGVKAGDILKLVVTGTVLTPRFSDVYEKKLSCSWMEVIFVPHIVGREYGEVLSLIGPRLKFGSCLVLVRDFLGFDKMPYDFVDGVDEVRLKIQGKDERFSLDGLIDYDEQMAAFELIITDEMIKDDSSLQFIVESKLGHFVKIGVIEILEDESKKPNIKIIDTSLKSFVNSTSDRQNFKVAITTVGE